MVYLRSKMVGERHGQQAGWVWRRGALATSLLAALLGGCAPRQPAASQPAASQPAASQPTASQPTSAATAGTSTASCSNATMLATWSVARRAEQVVAVPVLQGNFASALPVVRLGVGGLLLVGVSGRADLSSRLAQVKAEALGGIAPLVMSDEEGGAVQRVADLVGSMPSAQAMAATLTTDQVRTLAANTARRLVANGVTMDLAPDVDLAPGLGAVVSHSDSRRSFSADPALTTSYGVAFARGMVDGGVIPVLKHFPGEGHANASTDFGAADTPPLSSLEGSDLVPFEAAIKAGLPAIMVGNATVPGLSDGPASLSAEAVTGLLRQRLGFHGLVLSDSLTAGAISVTRLDLGQAAVAAIKAGVDMVIVGSGNPNTLATTIVERLVADAGRGALPLDRLTAAAANVLKAKAVNLCRPSP